MGPGLGGAGPAGAARSVGSHANLHLGIKLGMTVRQDDLVE
jgi:hypothetical protein